jgi:alkanesulfonate monooxygenase SsuD/methylene tetrahydromethanopterin reductase-like flavin-dependent oxidoreductase (luciferase family)
MAYTPLQKPHPPIWVAAQSEAAIRRAARVGDAPWVPFQVGYSDVRQLFDAYRQELGRVGKPYPNRIPMMRFVSVDRDADAARERVRPLEGFFTWYAQSPYFTKVKVNYSHEEELRERTIAGTPEQVVEGLGRYTDDFGVNVFDLFVLWPSTDRQAVRDHLAFIGAEVLAPLRARVPKQPAVAVA